MPFNGRLHPLLIHVPIAIALFAAGALVAGVGHFAGLLLWGATVLRP